ncbi:MAG TPA: trypsin-like peptidase domain-containing protein [Verrucomicrobiae bacterium]|nr:trypsin-like peptidase domain-containing protein [Verrucomicrobiae bacterium]
MRRKTVWLLVKDAHVRYCLIMLRKFVCVSAALAVCAGAKAVQADVVQLKDNAQITGKILAEKRDQVAIDIGYTVLVIPRNQIEKISHSQPNAGKPTPPPAPMKTVPLSEVNAPTFQAGFYSANGKAAPEKSVRELVNVLGEAVVQVRTPSGLGSGFIINEDGFLMTNFHVIEGETQISVAVYHEKDGQLEPKVYKQVRIVAVNKFADMALLKIEDKDAPKFKYVLLGTSDNMQVGESVFAIGSPLGLERTVTEGIISTKTREFEGTLYLQTTAQINPGNSGGPLFNMAGEVVGITNMKITFGEGLGFAIPIEGVKYFLDHRDAFAYSNDNPSNPYRYLEPPSHTRHANMAEGEN